MTYACLHRQSYRLGAFSLVPLRYEDRFAIMRWRNQQLYHLRQSRPLTEQDQQTYFDTVVSALYTQSQPDQVLFSYLQDSVCIGYGGLVHINWKDRHAEVSFIMDTALEAEGFARHWTNYLTLLREMAFGDLRLHKLFTYAFDLRPHLYPVLEAAGFVREATLKEHCIHEGQYKDVVIHAATTYQTVNYTDCSRESLLEILALRNRDDIRCHMTHPEPISERDHLSFVQRLKGDPDRLYYAVYRGGHLLGTCNFSRESDTVWERGILAAPDAQGKGETALWERQLIGTLPAQVKALSAKVKADNTRSVRYHEKMGYEEQSRDGEYIYYLLQL